MKLLTKTMLGAIRLYRSAQSGKLSPCRFYPSCSQFAMDAIDLHGPRRGTWLAIKRLARCRPFGAFGWDPVPDPPEHDSQEATRPDHVSSRQRATNLQLSSN